MGPELRALANFAGPPAHRRQEDGAQEGGYKTRKYKKDCPKRGCHLGVSRCRARMLLCEAGADAVSIAALEPSEQQRTRDGGGDTKRPAAQNRPINVAITMESHPL